MALRTFLSIALASLVVGPLTGSSVLRYPLDDRAVYTLRVGVEAPTTVMFPGPVTALDAAGLATHAEDQPPVLLSHQAGARFFSVRALRPGASAAANVVFHDRVYAFAFVASEAPDRSVTFYESPKNFGRTPSALPWPDHLLALLDQAKNYPALADQYPALVQNIERSTPATTTVVASLTTCLEEVFRFPADDAVVFRFRVENHSPAARRYMPAQLGVQVAERVFPAALTDATGLIPPQRSERFYLVVVGDPRGGRADLSLQNTFTLVVPSEPASK